jgi:DnaJ-class molecular chaperone
MTNDEDRGSDPSTGSAVGGEMVRRLRAFNEMIDTGDLFERLTRIPCARCNGTGMTWAPGHPAIMSMCPMCGGIGAMQKRERIDPMNVTVESDGRVVIRDQ